MVTRIYVELSMFSLVFLIVLVGKSSSREYYLTPFVFWNCDLSCLDGSNTFPKCLRPI